MRKILLTGASGRIGRAFYEAAQDRYQVTLCDLHEPAYSIQNGDKFVQADLTDVTVATDLVKGHETIVHLAGIPDADAAFADLLPVNLLATTYLLDAAAKAGCRRFVFASSAQVIEGYQVDKQIPDGAAPRPANLYGVVKAYGEALCAYHAHRHDITCVALRIGAFEPEMSDDIATARDLSAWLSHRDAAVLIERAIEADIDGFFVAHGISDNRFKRMELTETRRVLGYAPADNAFDVFDLSLIHTK